MEVNGVKVTVSFNPKISKPCTYDLCNLQIGDNGIVNIFYDKEIRDQDGYQKSNCVDIYKLADVLSISIDKTVEKRMAEGKLIPLFPKGEDSE